MESESIKTLDPKTIVWFIDQMENEQEKSRKDLMLRYLSFKEVKEYFIEKLDYLPF